MSVYGPQPLNPQVANMYDNISELFGMKSFQTMMKDSLASMLNFNKSLTNISKAIFPKLISGMLKMIPITALLEPLTALIGGLMIFMEPLTPVLEALGMVLGTSLLPLTTWLTDKLMLLMPYISGFADGLRDVIYWLTQFIDKLRNESMKGLETQAAARGVAPWEIIETWLLGNLQGGVPGMGGQNNLAWGGG